ncbi:DUF4167 domain-containing protein [Roseomonas sp. SSH11]|uniref:DUF4167 domain-containing protein n=1 Tax=Pararoseomonas baculiformis TaxID=2820812 RepID=A0ABS4AKN8_9PROT|nr:DUF4167 domain-containing protein [Pararoseomonas baculiformis]MBP0447607.1 DUF4167 domain-containing protein [Pararoseomonas baculiformis]
MNMKRMRGRGNFRQGGHGGGGGGGGGPRHHNTGNQPMNRNHVFDSIGPDMRMRGTAQQLFEKYLQLGRDATGSGDRVMAEGYFQHAEHYFRILTAMNQAQQQQGGGAAPQHGGRRYQGGDGQGDGFGEPDGDGNGGYDAAPADGAEPRETVQ